MISSINLLVNLDETANEWIDGFIVTENEPNLFADPYNSVWTKIFGTLFYIFQVSLSFILMTFVVYETQGLAGHYRTLINQLLSWFYLLVSDCFFFLLPYAHLGEFT